MDKDKNTSGASTLNSNQRTFFKYHGHGYISSDGPTKKIISFDEDDDKEEKAPLFDEEPDGEAVYANKGKVFAVH